MSLVEDDKRKIILQNLLNTFESNEGLHEIYKNKMKEIIEWVFIEFGEFLKENEDYEALDLGEWINNFVEEHFRPI